MTIYWAGRIRATVDWQDPGDWGRPRAIVAQTEPGLAVADVKITMCEYQYFEGQTVDRLLTGAE